MPNKTLISLAVASSIALTGCLGDGGSSGSNANPDYKIDSERFSGKTWPRFEPAKGDLPIPSDLNFRTDNAATEGNEADGSFQVLTDDPNPVTEALNQLSGASTVAPPVIVFDGDIDASTVDARAFILTGDAANPVIPNPNQNVFLIELDYASGDPVQALSISEPPTIPVAVTAAQAAGGDLAAGGALVALAQNPTYEAEVVSLSGDSAIRINPTTPLKPFTRYVVAVTTEVLDINGDPIVSSPSYSNLTLDGDDAPILSSNLAPVRRLINSLWEPIATSYFGVNNAARGEGNALTADDIALSYSFTTSNDERVLAYIARPAKYFEETLTGALRVGAAEAVLEANPDAAYEDILPAADGAVSDAGFATTDTAAALTAAGIFTLATNFGGCADVSVKCAGVGLQIANAGSPETPPTPSDRSGTAEFGTPQDVTLVSAVTSQAGIAFGEVNLVQGSIELPYYLGVPSADTNAGGAVINTQSWEADADLAAQIGAQLGVTFGQSDPEVSEVVNYRFPFPREVGTVEVPIMVFYPATGVTLSDGSIPAVMYMHGITTDRSAALTFGSNLAKNAGVAVVVIDQPLHGVAPFSTEEQRELAETLLTSGQESGLPSTLAPSEDNINTLIAGELAYGATVSLLDGAGTIDASDGIDDGENAIVEGTIAAALTTGTGDVDLDAVIRALTSFQNTVANAGSTVPGIAPTNFERHFDFTASAENAPTPMEFVPSAAFGESGSLFINLTNFTNSRDKNRQAVVDLLNVRASLAGLDFDGTAGADLDAEKVHFTGHSLGAIVGAPFVAVANEQVNPAQNILSASLLTPGGGIVRLLENSPTFAPRILGGLAASAGLQQGDAALETFFNVNQATIDSADPINFADNLVESQSKVLLSQVNGDLVIPNEAEETPYGAAFKAYLSGTQPLADELGAEAVTGDPNPLFLDDAAITRYTAGTHGTPVLPQGGELDERVFAEMVGQSTSLVVSEGAAVQVIDAAPADIIQQD